MFFAEAGFACTELLDVDEVVGGYGNEQFLKDYLHELLYAEEDSQKYS